MAQASAVSMIMAPRPSKKPAKRLVKMVSVSWGTQRHTVMTAIRASKR